jgi:CRISPR-associated protein Cas2
VNRRFAVSYDIADPRRLRRVAKIMEGFGERVQWSVFECCLDKAAFSEARRLVSEAIDAEEDSVRWYPLCAWCAEKVERQGLGGPVEDPPYFIV